MYKKWLIGAIAATVLSSQAFASESCQNRPLRHDMDNIKHTLKSMSSHIRSGENKLAEKDTETLISLFKAARNETPYSFVKRDLKGDELAKETQKFHGVIDDTIAVFTSLDEALKAGDSGKVKSLMGQIGEQRRIGHSSFKSDC